MKILLAGLGFKNNDLEYNLNVILDIISKYSNNINLIVFGEAFLQGFDSLSWDFNKDKLIAISQNDNKIKIIKDNCIKNNVGVSFGYYELVDESIYSSQMTIDNKGKIIDNYRRVSIGWKEKYADYHYVEGKKFNNFRYLDKDISVSLCGDMWDDNNLQKIIDLKSDIVLWPVYCDYDANEWNENIKYEYASQVKNISSSVLLVNSFCLNGIYNDSAKAGCCYFKEGKIKKEITSGIEDVLIVEI